MAHDSRGWPGSRPWALALLLANGLVACGPAYRLQASPTPTPVLAHQRRFVGDWALVDNANNGRWLDGRQPGEAGKATRLDGPIVMAVGVDSFQPARRHLASAGRPGERLDRLDLRLADPFPAPRPGALDPEQRATRG